MALRTLIVDGSNQAAKLCNELRHHQPGLIDQGNGVDDLLPQVGQSLEETVDVAQEAVGSAQQSSNGIRNKGTTAAAAADCDGADLRLSRAEGRTPQT